LHVIGRRFLASSSGGSPGKPTSTKGLKPKILDESPPVGDEQSEDVKQHNREMDQRADRAHARIENKDAPKDKMPPPKKDEAERKNKDS
jgi:hypothetical protein